MSERVHVRAFRALSDLSVGLQSFHDSSNAILFACEHDVRRFLDWLQSARLACESAVRSAESELESARDALAACQRSGDDDSHSCDDEERAVGDARQQLGEIAATLREVRQGEVRARDAVNEFQRASRIFVRTTTDDFERARGSLSSKLSSLQTYADLRLPTSRTAGRGLEPRDPGGPLSYDDPQLPIVVADSLAAMDELKDESWQSMTNSAREQMLQRAENAVAALMNRPPSVVVVKPLQTNNMGWYERGTNTLAFNSHYLSDLDETLDTLLHEGRHAQQCQVTKADLANNDPIVEAWRTNQIFYNQYDQSGLRLYFRQPIEVDARAFAKAVLQHLRQPSPRRSRT